VFFWIVTVHSQSEFHKVVFLIFLSTVVGVVDVVILNNRGTKIFRDITARV